MIAEHLFWLHFLGLRDAATDRKLANELLARRRDDGTWSNWFEGPADLSTTIESYVALKMAGVDAGDATRDYIRRRGGIPRSARLHEVLPRPARPVAVAARSRRCRRRSSCCRRASPFSIYNFACWARQTVVPLSVVHGAPRRHAPRPST